MAEHGSRARVSLGVGGQHRIESLYHPHPPPVHYIVSAETETQAKGRMFYISHSVHKENNMAALYRSTVLQWCEI